MFESCRSQHAYYTCTPLFSPMTTCHHQQSPAHGPPDGLHSWVGIINYLPLAVSEQDEVQRRAITNLFKGPYCNLMKSIGVKYNATSHWAKLELPATVWQLANLRLFMEQRFPLHQFNQARARLDPKNLLANDLINKVLGVPSSTQSTTSPDPRSR